MSAINSDNLFRKLKRIDKKNLHLKYGKNKQST